MGSKRKNKTLFKIQKQVGGPRLIWEPCARDKYKRAHGMRALLTKQQAERLEQC